MTDPRVPGQRGLDDGEADGGGGGAGAGEAAARGDKALFYFIILGEAI